MVQMRRVRPIPSSRRRLGLGLTPAHPQYRFSVKFDITWQPITKPGAFGIVLTGPAMPVLHWHSTQQTSYEYAGGLDLHDALTDKQPSLLARLAGAMDAFLPVGFAMH